MGMGRFALLLVVLVGVLVSSCASWRAARLYQSGTLALDRGESQLAIADLERASELAPHASEVRNHLGLAHLAAGDHESARRAFEQAVALDCENQAAQRNLWATREPRAEGP